MTEIIVYMHFFSATFRSRHQFHANFPDFLYNNVMPPLQKSSEKKHNYNRSLSQLIEHLKKTGRRPSLCLHACCGPCSSYVLEFLADYFDITVLYYNPNIYPETEYSRRFQELKNLYSHYKPVLENKVKLLEIPYNPEEYYNAIDVRNNPSVAHEPEKGNRCFKCYELRLKRTYEYAKEHSFDYFCTTLSISPFKDAEAINKIGMSLTGVTEWKSLKGNGIALPDPEEGKPVWLLSDFKKNGGFRRSLELTEEYGMYRQEYCGCIYSATNDSENSVIKK